MILFFSFSFSFSVIDILVHILIFISTSILHFLGHVRMRTQEDQNQLRVFFPRQGKKGRKEQDFLIKEKWNMLSRTIYFEK